MAVVIETTLGDLTVDLFIHQRPQTCKNFIKLCKLKYYNYNLFHTIQHGFIAQTGDPTGQGDGGQSIWGLLSGPDKKYFKGETNPKIKHVEPGTLSMVTTDDGMVASQFFFTLGPNLDSLDGRHCVIGQVTEGHEILRLINETICDTGHRPYQDVRITHTVILEDPFDDPSGFKEPDRSPSPSAERLAGGRIAPDEEIDETKDKTEEEILEMIQDREAKARATILEIVGDLPDADIAPPENVLFVCKLNPVTNDDDLEIIFSRFGKIKSSEVIRDKKSGDSLQYAFIEFEDKKSCEDAYFKMDNVLIDDRRIHVDFSQSVSQIRWRGKGRGVIHLKGGNDFKQENYNRNHRDNSNKKSFPIDRERKANNNYDSRRNDNNYDSRRNENNYDSRRNENSHRENRQQRNDNRDENKSNRYEDRKYQSDRKDSRYETARNDDRLHNRKSSPYDKRYRERTPEQMRNRDKRDNRAIDNYRNRSNDNYRKSSNYRDRSPDRRRNLSPDRRYEKLHDKTRNRDNNEISVRYKEREENHRNEKYSDKVKDDSKRDNYERNKTSVDHHRSEKSNYHKSSRERYNSPPISSKEKSSASSKRNEIEKESMSDKKDSKNKKRKHQSDSSSESNDSENCSPSKRKRKTTPSEKMNDGKKRSQVDENDSDIDKKSKKTSAGISTNKKKHKKHASKSKVTKKKRDSSTSSSSSSDSDDSSSDSSSKKKKSKKQAEKVLKSKKSKKASESDSSSSDSSSDSDTSSSNSNSSDSGHEQSRKKSKNKKSVREKLIKKKNKK